MKKSNDYTFVGRIPELNYYLLRDNRRNKIEAWTMSRGTSFNVIQLEGYELEFVRELKCAYRVPDTEFNRANVPGDIGRIYVDQAPALAEVTEL